MAKLPEQLKRPGVVGTGQDSAAELLRDIAIHNLRSKAGYIPDQTALNLPKPRAYSYEDLITAFTSSKSEDGVVIPPDYMHVLSILREIVEWYLANAENKHLAKEDFVEFDKLRQILQYGGIPLNDTFKLLARLWESIDFAPSELTTQNHYDFRPYYSWVEDLEISEPLDIHFLDWLTRNATFIHHIRLSGAAATEMGAVSDMLNRLYISYSHLDGIDFTRNRITFMNSGVSNSLLTNSVMQIYHFTELLKHGCEFHNCILRMKKIVRTHKSFNFNNNLNLMEERVGSRIRSRAEAQKDIKVNSRTDIIISKPEVAEDLQYYYFRIDTAWES